MKRDSSAQAGARRLLFLWDADAFGGHDRMALDGLERLAGEPVDFVVAGELVARGEVVVIDENFGIRLTELVEGGA